MPNILTFFSNPFFWAFIGMFALIGSSTTLCCKHLKKYPYLNMFFVGIFALGRIILVSPSCPQPRFEIYDGQLIIGGLIFIIGVIFLIPLFYIKPFPEHIEDIKLVTTGFYGIVRNPIYLGEILWTLGWAIIFGSIIGVALVPLWWGGLLFHVMLEEEDLERKIGQPYLNYKLNVRGRIIPGLPL
jgi:protein-S-isoprenylcysteine O-methyltransferase Ste14